MKTRELIRRLQEADPSGEIECCVGNIDIFHVGVEPAYYDGCLEVLIHDPAKAPYYDVVGAKYYENGQKLVIDTHSISDALDDADLAIDYSDLSQQRAKRYREIDEKTRQRHKDINRGIELDHFQKFIRGKAADFSSNNEWLEGAAERFFDSNGLLSRIPPMLPPRREKHGLDWNRSWNERREAEWSEHVKLDYDGLDWKLEWVEAGESAKVAEG